MKNKFILGMSVLSIALSLSGSFKKTEYSSNNELLVRVNDYSTLISNSSFAGFEDVIKEEDENTITFKGTKYFERSIFDGLDFTKISINDKKAETMSEATKFKKTNKLAMEFVATVRKREKILKVSAEFKNFKINIDNDENEIEKIESIEGFYTYNNRGEKDLLFACEDGDTWLSDISTSRLDETGFWDWIKSVANAIVDTVENVVEEIVETATEVLETFVEFIEDVTESVSDFIEELPAIITDAAEILVENVINCTYSAYQDLINLINSLDDGFLKDALLCLTNNPIENVAKLLNENKSLFTDFIALGIRCLTDFLCYDNLEYWAQFLCMYKEIENGHDIYHADQDCWQKAAGYNDIYDAFFHLGSSMEAEKFDFYDVGKDGKNDYVLWAWKGDYWTLGCGAELGIYRRLNDSEHFVMDYSLAMDMSMVLYYQGEEIINWQDERKDWWMTAFDSDTRTYPLRPILASDIEVKYQITFNPEVDEELLNSLENSFFEGYVNKVGTDKTWKTTNDLHVYTWDWKAKNGWTHK